MEFENKEKSGPHESTLTFGNRQRFSRAGMWMLTLPAMAMIWSEEVFGMLGLARGDTAPGLDAFLSFVADECRAGVSAWFGAVAAGRQPGDIDFLLQPPGAAPRSVQAHAELVHGADAGAYALGTLRDIIAPAIGRVEPVAGIDGGGDVTGRRHATLALTRSHRALRMLSQASQAVMRASREGDLLDEICRLAVGLGGYRMAWVGYACDDADKSIDIVGMAGEAADIAAMRAARFSWEASSQTGLEPAGETIREGRVASVPDVSLLNADSALAGMARRCGYRGALSLPLRDAGHTFGVMFLCSRDALEESGEEMTLLRDLADNLAFGIAGLRVREGQKRLHAAIEKVASSVTVSSPARFLDQLAHNMMEAVGGSAGFILRARTGDEPTLGTIACVGAGTLEERARLDIADTPCELFTERDFVLVPDRLSERFPGCTRLVSFPARAFAGHRLTDTRGRAAGMLFVLFAHPVRDGGFIDSALRIFATRAAAELEQRDADSRIREQASLLDKAQDAIIVRSLDNRIEYWNKSAERLYGWQAHEIIGEQAFSHLVADNDAFTAATQVVLRLGEWTGESTHLRKDGGAVVVESRWTLLRNDDGTPRSILSINTDITHRRQAEQKIKQLAFYDSLTQLPNRLLLLDRLEIAKVKSGRSGSHGALLFVDLDNFKTLNDTLGHDKGDRLLQMVAARLTASVRAEDTVARLGGDEFVVMLESLGCERDDATQVARTIGEKILSAFCAPFQLSGYEHYSTPSIGVTLFQGPAELTDDILKRADMAMYQAKATGRNTVCFFDPAMQVLLRDRASLEADIRHGLAQQEFTLHYQPQVDDTGRVTGAEALLRWHHPQRGIVPTSAFIPVSEEAGLILALGQWVLEAACQQLVDWAKDPAMAALTLAINISTRQLRHPDFVDQVLGAIARHGIDATRLKLELTESVLVDNPESAVAKMSALKAHGIDFALDDFGTGYSSLSYLKRLPLDKLKIDQSFVRDIPTDANDAAIVRSIIALGRSLGLGVIAEGVETEAQRAFLEAQGCLSYQGFLFSPPLQADAFRHYLCARNGPGVCATEGRRLQRAEKSPTSTPFLRL